VKYFKVGANEKGAADCIKSFSYLELLPLKRSRPIGDTFQRDYSLYQVQQKLSLLSLLAILGAVPSFSSRLVLEDLLDNLQFSLLANPSPRFLSPQL
jgi:hypothetical protein